ncbi:Protein F41C3.5 [Aphelenchoides avenae]|nr:Protein F41C3.5 [Aphelenchus avenae]
MNLPEVCQALHVPRNNCGDWDADDAHVDDWYEDSLTATQAVLQALRFHVRVLIYYGDNALLSSIAGGRRWAYGQGLENTVDSVPWHYKGALAGFHSIFARGNLTYATLSGVGMQASRQRPQQTKHLVRQFLKNQPL